MEEDMIKERNATGLADLETIDPSIASDMLSRMPSNRRLRQRDINRYEKSMLAGEWNEELLDPIHITTDNNIINGQHRLHAIIKTGLSFVFLVVRGLPASSYKDIDQGRSRTLADALDVRGENHTLELASMINLLYTYDKTGVLAKLAMKAPERANISEGLAYFDSHETIKESLPKGHLLRRRFQKGASRWAAVHYILTNIDREDAAAFLDQLESGEHLQKGDPIYHLRARLLDNIVTVRTITEIEYTALILKTWNLYRDGRTVSTLSWRPGGSRPEAYPAPH